MEPAQPKQKEESKQAILTDPEIFDEGINKRLNAIFISMGLKFGDHELKFFKSEIPQFIKDMYSSSAARA